jgi:hypothetical protein
MHVVALVFPSPRLPPWRPQRLCAGALRGLRLARTIRATWGRTILRRFAQACVGRCVRTCSGLHSRGCTAAAARGRFSRIGGAGPRCCQATASGGRRWGEDFTLASGARVLVASLLPTPSLVERFRGARAGWCTADRPGAALHRRGAALHRRGAALHLRGAALHRRGAALHLRGAALHRRGAALHLRGAALHRRGAALHRRGAALHRRGAALTLPRSAASPQRPARFDRGLRPLRAGFVGAVGVSPTGGVGRGLGSSAPGVRAFALGSPRARRVAAPGTRRGT